jgi:hypothetical protein
MLGGTLWPPAIEGFGTPIMDFEFRCVNCEALLRLREAAAGKRIKCPRCAAMQIAPGGPAPMAEPPQGPRPLRITPPDDEELDLADIPKAPPYRPELTEPPVPVAKLVSSSIATPQKAKTPQQQSGAKLKAMQTPAAKQVPTAKLAPSPTPIAKPAQTPVAKPSPASRPPPAQAPLPPAQAPPPPVAQGLSPLADLDNLLGDQLMSGPSAQGARPAYDFPALPSAPEAAPAPVRRVYSDKPRRRRDASGPMTVLKIPAIAMMLFSGVTAGLLIVNLCMSGYRLYLVLSSEGRFEENQMSAMVAALVTAVVFDLIYVLIHAIIFRAGACMLSGRNYSMARTGAILAAIPCCGVLSFPFGIWAFIMLSMESVKDAFD